MAWQQPRFTFHRKLLAQDEKNYLGTLEKKLKKVWCQEMTAEYFKNLSDSMPKHLQMIIKN